MAENEQPPASPLFPLAPRGPPTPSVGVLIPHCRSRRLDSPRFGASHDSATAAVGPRLRPTHAPLLATAMAHARPRARMHGTARNETRNNPARAALLSCGPIAPRRYRHTEGGMRGARGGRMGRGTPRARHASKTAARGLSPAYLPTCIVAMSSRERSTRRPVTTAFKAQTSMLGSKVSMRASHKGSHAFGASSCTEYLTLDA